MRYRVYEPKGNIFVVVFKLDINRVRKQENYTTWESCKDNPAATALFRTFLPLKQKW